MKRLLFLETARSSSGATPKTSDGDWSAGSPGRTPSCGENRGNSAGKWIIGVFCFAGIIVCSVFLWKMIPGLCNDIKDIIQDMIKSIDWRYFQIPLI